MGSTERRPIIPERAAKPIGPYSPGIRSGNLVFVSGTIGIDPSSGAMVEGGVASETRQILRNLQTVLEAAGSSLDQVVKTTVFMLDLKQFATMNEVYAVAFSGAPPARSTVQVAGLPGGASVEIEAIAIANG